MNLLPFLETTLPGIMIPSIILTDSYKMAHFSEYPECEKMVAYGEFRKPLDKDDNRIVFYGIRYWIKIIAKQWTLEDVSKCEIFLSTHNIGEPYPFPRDLFISFINECDGHFPVEIEALDEASVIYPHVPVFQITALNKYSKLVTFLETLLTMIWYPCNVATISRHTKSAIDLYYSKTVDEGSFSSIHTKLHDFGFRGCTSVDQSVIGGVAHLLNFTGSDTLSACYYAQFELNKGRPVGFSIPATEHSVMTAWQSEEAAIRNMIEKYGEGVYACVMDSYDYVEALSSVLPNIAKEKTAKGGYLVLRPDSGDPVTTVLQALDASDKVFGSVLNSKGYKVVQGCGVIQGDGISKSIVLDILKAAESKGYSAENISFGMGAGLLQKHNRDTMSFATKLCFIEYSNKTVKHVMKSPKTDDSKTSLPGQLAVLENELGVF
eukprot:NODE_242_length_13076_cov_0.518379.p3 type:complete len:435 gc:universal NODE_242_length_13076_cov_0.518379:5107-6411(+)